MMTQVKVKVYPVSIGYGDRAGKRKKVWLSAIVTLSDDFQYKKILFGSKILTLQPVSL